MALSKMMKIVIGVGVGLLVLGLIIGLVVHFVKKSNDKKKKVDKKANITTNKKAVEAMCSSTTYKDTCHKSLSEAKSTEPKDLIKTVFQVGMKNLSDVVKNSALFKEAANDESVKEPLNLCGELLNYAVGDFNKSADRITNFDPNKATEYTGLFKTWLSAVVTYQDTCLDEMEKASGETAEKLKKVMKFAREVTLNGLSMVDEFSKLLAGLDLGKIKGGSGQRRLLSWEDEPPEFARRALAAADELTPKAVVAQDGSGQYKTISSAIAAVPPKGTTPYVIRIKAGEYKENVNITKKADKIMLIGDGPTKTKITGSLSTGPGLSTYGTATVGVNGDEFFAKDLTIENTAGAEKHQAVALRLSGESSVLYNVHLLGFQDTLYSHAYRQYYRDCTISGTIDYVFGDARALFQNCNLITRKPMANQACMVTAQGKSEPMTDTAFVFQNCTFSAEKEVTSAQPPVKVYLGRPWKSFSRTVIMSSDIGGFIHPDGWAPWDANMGTDTLTYIEYENRGPGASRDKRVNWKGYMKQVTPQVAQFFLGSVMFYNNETFIKDTKVPYNPNMMKI